MALVRANGIEKDISLMVFDKDGLMFRSQPFWSHIGQVRIQMLRTYLGEDGIADWARIFGLTMEDGRVVYTDPKVVTSPFIDIIRNWISLTRNKRPRKFVN